MSEIKTQRLETWTAAEVHLSVEYAATILDEINGYAAEGLKHLSRSGIAVGGVLFGSRREKTVRILTWRPIACEHVKGSIFILSPKDRKGLAQLLTGAKDDPELADMHTIGWFVSHTREGVLLNEADLEVYTHFFPWSWQVALVIRPFRDRPSRAGFFVRDTEGRVKTDVSYREFEIKGTAAASSRPVHHPVIAEYEPAGNGAPANEPSSQQSSLDKVGREEPLRGGAREPVEPRRSGLAARVFSDRRLWIWTVPVILAAVVWAVILDKPAPAPVTPSLGFRALDSAGQLRLQWDRSSKPVREAARGTLSLWQGGAPPVQLELNSGQLELGSLLYPRRSADVEAVLTVFPAEGKPIEESARFVGPPISPPAIEDATELRRQRDALLKANEQLRDDLQHETNRNRDLEDAIKALKNRAEVEGSQKPK